MGVERSDSSNDSVAEGVPVAPTSSPPASSPSASSPRLKVFIVCSGLGRIMRGLESFTKECFDALSESPEIDIVLFKGGGPSSRREKVLWHLPRDGKAAKFIGRIFKKECYFIEQVTFSLALIPRIARMKPDVIYFSDSSIGGVLRRWRRLTGKRFQLLFSNGAPFPPPFTEWDHVQQLTEPHYQAAIICGDPPSKHSLIPYGIQMKSDAIPASHEEKAALRERLGLPSDRLIIISVAALNKSHKRVDYLINEVASLASPRPFLLMLGQHEPETPEILELADRKLSRDDYKIDTVDSQQVVDYYRASDLFVLASVSEGFGRVFVEAMSQGLPCLTHDYGVSRYVLGEYGYFADFNREGALADLIREVDSNITEATSDTMRQARHLDAYRRFSWDGLKPQYLEMLHRVAANGKQAQ